MSSTDEQAQIEACIEAGMPAAEHELLASLAGSWRAEVRHWMDPSEPPHESQGTMTNELLHEGRFIQHTYCCDTKMFQGNGYFGFNRGTGKWEGVWIDNMSTAMLSEAGDYDADAKTWTMTGTVVNPMTGEPMTKRSIIRVDDEDHHTMEMHYEFPEGTVKVMEIAYSRG